MVLETLTPAERLAFVLHDMFAVPFDEIAEIVDRSPDATRQLAAGPAAGSAGPAPDPDTDLAEQRRVVDAFLAAARAGDFEGLVAVLDPDVVVRADRAIPRAHRSSSAERRRSLRGPSPSGNSRRSRGRCSSTGRRIPRRAEGRLFAVAALTVVGGRITEIDFVADPDKLKKLALS